MKKIASFFLAALFVGVLHVSAAFAAANPNPGWCITNLQLESGYALAVQTGDGTQATLDQGIYYEVEKLQLSFSGSASQYMVYLLAGEDATPTEENLYYINQSAGGSVSFLIYPQDLASDGVYSIYLSSTTGGYQKIATFEVVLSEIIPELGDVMVDGTVDIKDAILLQQSISGAVSLTQEQQGVANLWLASTSGIDLDDASYLLGYRAGNFLALS